MLKTRQKTRQIAFAEPMIGEAERAAVLEVLAGTTLVHGPRAEAFERAFAEFTGAPIAISLASCTAAMYLAYLHLGLGPGDEVIVPAETHVATAHAVELTGARPVFVDAEEATGNIDVAQIEANITSKTRALAVVHFLGLPVAMDEVMHIAQRHGLFVVEDCALALGSFWHGTHAGLVGDVGCFSFYPVKHITTAEGGMLICRDADVARAIKPLRAFGVDKAPAERKAPGEYDVLALGGNFRLNELSAALGVEQLKKLPDFLRRRRRNAALLREGLAGVTGIRTLAAGTPERMSSEYCYAALLDEALVPQKAEIVRALNERGVGTSVYYPKPVPHLSYYREKYGSGNESFPVAASISRRMIALPVGPHLTEDDVAYMVEVIRDVLA